MAAPSTSEQRLDVERHIYDRPPATPAYPAPVIATLRRHARPSRARQRPTVMAERTRPTILDVIRTRDPAGATSTRPVIIRRRRVSRCLIGRRRVIGPPVIAVIVGRRRQRHERRGDDRGDGADYGAHHAKRPEQRKRRARGRIGRIVLRLGIREPAERRARRRTRPKPRFGGYAWGSPRWNGPHDSRRQAKRKSHRRLAARCVAARSWHCRTRCSAAAANRPPRQDGLRHNRSHRLFLGLRQRSAKRRDHLRGEQLQVRLRPAWRQPRWQGPGVEVGDRHGVCQVADHPYCGIGVDHLQQSALL